MLISALIIAPAGVGWLKQLDGSVSHHCAFAVPQHVTGREKFRLAFSVAYLGY